MEMQEMTSFQLPDEIVQPFSISSAGDTLTVCAKEHTFVLQLKYKHFTDDSGMNYVLSRIKCSTARPTGQFLAHETNLYNSSDIEQRKQIMLDQTILPNIAKVYINSLHSWVSPAGILRDHTNGHLIANVTNMGQLTIYRQHKEWMSNWITYADVSASWLKHIYDGRAIEEFQRLQTLIHETLITSFCWQDKVHQHPSQFVFGTKSGKLVFCTLAESEPKIEYVHQQLEASFVLKYVSLSSSDHFLLAGGKCGRVVMYRFDARNVRKTFKNVATFFEEDLTVSTIECEVDTKTGHFMMLVVKGYFLLVLNASTGGETLGSGTLDLGHFMITGLQQLEPCKYIVSTMEGAIFLVTIERMNDGGLKLRHRQMKSDLNVGSYALYGVTTTRTRSCWIFLGFPSVRYDHLTLRTPISVFFAKFSMREALEVLQSNQTLKMTNYYDAAEVVRYNAIKNSDLKEMEQVDLSPQLNNAFSYQLKLHLISLGAKIAYQKRRNKATTEILHNQLQFLCTMIEVINAASVLSYLADLAKRKPTFNPMQQSAVLCLRNFIHNIVEDSFPGDYEYVHLGLKPGLVEILQKTDAIPMLPYEICYFCDAQIASNRCTCRKGHPVFRCVTTKIQIPLEDDETTCDMCQRYSLRMSILDVVLDDKENLCPIDYTKCCVCDVPFRTKS